MSRDRSTKTFLSLLHMKTIENTSRPGIFVKYQTALAWVEQGACDWVKKGRSIVELDRSERLARMADNKANSRALNHAQAGDWLPPIEPDDHRFVSPTHAQIRGKVLYDLLGATIKFYANPVSECRN